MQQQTQLETKCSLGDESKTVPVSSLNDEITFKLYLDDPNISFTDDDLFFGFVNVKLSSLCINGGKFLYPGEDFSVFPGSMASNLAKQG